MKTIFQILFIFCSLCLKSQIPDSILFKWKSYENPDKPLPQRFINAVKQGLSNTGQNDNSKLLQSIIDAAKSDSQTVVIFDEGIFKFSKTIFLKSYITLEGKGASKTKLIFDNGGTGHLFDISCYQKSQFCNLKNDIKKGSDYFFVDSAVLKSNSYCEILIDGTGKATSDWALQSIGQIVKVKTTENKMAITYGDFKHDFNVKNNLRYRLIEPITNVNFRFFSIERKDKTVNQTNNFNFNYAVNCSVRGVESKNCNMSHIAFSKSYNCTISDCYIHHAFDYGGGGKAYGVELSNTSSSCLIENNIFENLRHSMLLQSGANGNILTGNYSTKPYWDEGLFPKNSAGEIVLHGNYPFANLIEQNQVGNIVIDNSHGINGPNNLFFRNRASLWGVLMNSGSGNKTHFIGNEITGTLCSFAGDFNFVLSNYRVASDTANNNKINLPQSFYFYEKPKWWSQKLKFPLLGIQNPENSKNIPSFYRYGYDSLRALNTAEDVFFISFNAKIERNKNLLKYTFESDLQVNVKKIYLKVCPPQNPSWKSIGSNLSNDYLFQKYKYTDSLKLSNEACFSWEIIGINDKVMLSDSFCFKPESSIVSKIPNEEVKVFPNPFCEKIQIISKESATAKIVDNTGKTLISKSIQPSIPNEILTTNLSNGIYLLIIESSGKSQSHFIFKN